MFRVGLGWRVQGVGAWVYHFRAPYNKDDCILGSILGSPYSGKLPFRSATVCFDSWVCGVPSVNSRFERGSLKRPHPTSV